MPQPDFSQVEDNDRLSGDILHQRLLGSDILASSDIAVAYFGRVSQALKYKFPTTEKDLISDATTEAWQNYIHKPTSFDPSKLSLFGYLKMSAERDLINALEKIKRKNSRLVPLENVVEFPASFRNNPLEDDFIERQAVVEKFMAWQARRAGDATPTIATALDRKILDLMLAGERRAEPYARLLQIEDLDLTEQRLIVKRHKDRLRVRLKRHQANSGEKDD